MVKKQKKAPLFVRAIGAGAKTVGYGLVKNIKNYQANAPARQQARLESMKKETEAIKVETTLLKAKKERNKYIPPANFGFELNTPNKQTRKGSTKKKDYDLFDGML